MRKLDEEKLLIYFGGIAASIFVLVPLLRLWPRNENVNNLPLTIIWNIVFVTICIVLVGFDVLPEVVQYEIFSPGGVAVVGTIVPIYESIVAACTPSETNDRIWLQYWIASAIVSFSTEFIESITSMLPMAGEHWYEFALFFHLWLMLPMTNGAGIMYTFITKPYIAPIALKIKIQFEGYIGLFLTLINSGYIWILWIAMRGFDDEMKRFLVVALGTVYPIAASTVAITSNQTDLEETYWLTYWATFMPLFLAMDYLENFFGTIPGFYGVIACCTVYLFLPVFGGAEVVFRRILVPMSGQYRQMLLHDAYILKRSFEKTIPAHSREEFMRKVANLFTVQKKDQ